MVSINKVILLGRLGRDPESRYAAEGGTPICRFSLATSRFYKDRDGNRKEETEWHNVIVFGKTAEIAQRYLRKGSEAYIEGRVRTRKYTGKDGIERFMTEIICEQLRLGARPAGDDRSQQSEGGYESSGSSYAGRQDYGRPAQTAETPRTPPAPADSSEMDDIPF